MKDKTFSRRMVIGCGLGMVLTVLLAVAHAAEPPQFDTIQRTRYVMSLIRGEFNPDTGALVQISLADANDWAEAFYTAYGPLTSEDGELIVWDDLTADQKGRYYLRQMRKYHIAVRRSADVPTATDAAKATADAAVDTAAEIFPEIEE